MKSSLQRKVGAKKKTVKKTVKKSPVKKVKAKKTVKKAQSVTKKTAKKAAKKAAVKRAPASKSVKKASAMKTKKAASSARAPRKQAMDSVHERFKQEVFEALKSSRTQDAVHDDFKIEIIRELRELRALVEKNVQLPQTVEATLEDGVDSLRRLLSGLMEQRMESHMVGLIDLRCAVVSCDTEDFTDHSATLTAHIDRLLYEMGGIKFEADRMDYVDPLIHEIVAEHGEAELPDGVVVETLLPGFRTARGAILAKAHVAMNRRI